MKIYSIHYSLEALNDLDSIYCYLAFEQAEPSIAEKVYKSISSSIDNLFTFPKRNPLLKFRDNQRFYNIKNYLVIYQIDDDDDVVTIVRILGARQDIQSKLCKNL